VLLTRPRILFVAPVNGDDEAAVQFGDSPEDVRTDLPTSRELVIASLKPHVEPSRQATLWVAG